MKVELLAGLPRAERHKAAELYAQAFEAKFKNILGDEAVIVDLLVDNFNIENAIVAMTADGHLAGIAGYQVGAIGFTNISFTSLRQRFGFVSGGIRALLLDFLFSRKTSDSKQLIMDGIVVDESYRGMGIGTKLFNRLVQYARENGFTSIRLDVIDENPKARKLYERLGFAATHYERVPSFIARKISVSGATTMVKYL